MLLPVFSPPPRVSRRPAPDAPGARSRARLPPAQGGPAAGPRSAARSVRAAAARSAGWRRPSAGARPRRSPRARAFAPGGCGSSAWLTVSGCWLGRGRRFGGVGVDCGRSSARHSLRRSLRSFGERSRASCPVPPACRRDRPLVADQPAVIVDPAHRRVFRFGRRSSRAGCRSGIPPARGEPRRGVPAAAAGRSPRSPTAAPPRARRADGKRWRTPGRGPAVRRPSRRPVGVAGHRDRVVCRIFARRSPARRAPIAPGRAASIRRTGPSAQLGEHRVAHRRRGARPRR